MLRGRWPEAEQEARHARGELERFRLMDSVGFAHYEVGEVRLRMGDLTAAAEAFDRAYEYGHEAQPGWPCSSSPSATRTRRRCPSGGPRDRHGVGARPIDLAGALLPARVRSCWRG